MGGLYGCAVGTLFDSCSEGLVVGSLAGLLFADDQDPMKKILAEAHFDLKKDGRLYQTLPWVAKEGSIIATDGTEGKIISTIDFFIKVDRKIILTGFRAPNDGKTLSLYRAKYLAAFMQEQAQKKGSVLNIEVKDGGVYTGRKKLYERAIYLRLQ